MTVTRQQVINEARSWLGTPFGHQQGIKGLATDCDNFIAGVARNSGVRLVAEWENNYRHHEDGSLMLQLLEANLEFVSERLEDALPADVVTFCDDRLKHPERPRHLAFLTEWHRPGVPYMIHASESGVREHRMDFPLKRRVHSLWRIREIYERDVSEGLIAERSRETAEKKLQEFRDAIRAGEVSDPITAIFTIATLKAIAISAAVSYKCCKS